MDGARTFVALVPPPDVSSRLAEAAQATLASVRDLRLYPAQDLHLTLAFLGSIAAPVLERLKLDLDRACAGCGPLELAATHTGAFPGRSRARILWAGLERSIPLRALFQAAVSASRAAGSDPADADREPWTPRITLARVRGPRARVPDAFYELSFELSWTAREIAICQSDPRPGAVLRYPVVHRATL